MEYLTPEQVKGYALLKPIGTGGFGEVYLATETRPNFQRDVVLKRILPKYANDPAFIQRFESEARMIARLEYPYIVPLYDYWRDPNGAYLVMRWLKGGSVKDVLENGPLDLPAAVRIMNQVCSALALAHKNAIIHRDIKPGNILLDEEGNAYLSDFGIAKDFLKFDSNTQPEDIIGSPKYISPEQARSEAVTPRTDVYSLGVTLYEMLAGEHPFPNANVYDIIYKHLNEPLPLLATLDAAVQDDINLVIQKATAKNPQNRYESALDFARAFHAASQLDTTTQADSIEQQLTIREQQVLSLIVEGKTNKEIAGELFVTAETVKWHKRNAYRKLGVNRREQAIVVARNLKLVGSDASISQIDATSYIIDFEAENPYKGLESFTEADEANFFGRDKLVDKLIARLGQVHPHQRFLAVLGPSGSGKSSLVRAGLVPALWEGKLPDATQWLYTNMIPRLHPVDELDIALRRVATRHAADISDLLAHNERGLVKAASLILPDDDNQLLLIIDQFEEVFTLVESEEERVHFLNLITHAITDPDSRIRVVITIRADYYDRPLYYPAFGDILRDRVETVLPLSAEELQAAIVQPARKVGVKFEDGLVASIISDINYQPGSLPLLQYALTEMFDQRDGRTITRDIYEKIGGATGAIANTAEELFLSYDEAGQETIRQMFLRLVTLGEGAEDTRRRTGRDELLSIASDPDLMDDVIDSFAYARMLSLDNDPTTREPTVEVAHEAILREWERLRGWLNDSRDDIKIQRRLSQNAEAWLNNNYDDSYLITGTRLEGFERWFEGTNLSLSPVEQQFLTASITERERRVAKEKAQAERETNLQRRARRILQGLVAVFLVAAVVAGILALWANRERTRAEDEKARAEAAEEEALRQASIGLAALAEKELEGANPERGVLLGLEALEFYPYTPQAAEALGRSIEQYRPVRVLDAIGSVGDQMIVAAWSPDGKRVAGGSIPSPDTVIIWDAVTGSKLLSVDMDRELCSLMGHTDYYVRELAWSPSGERMATVVATTSGGDCGTVLWDTTSGETVLTLSEYEGAVWSANWSPDGTTILTGGVDGSARLWDAHTGAVRLELAGHTGWVFDAAFSPDGSRIATASEDGTVRVWNAETGEEEMVFNDHTGPVRSVDWSPDGTRLVTGGDDGLPRVWDAESGETLVGLLGHTDAVISVDWSSDGRYIASQSRDTTVKVWNPATGRLSFQIANAMSNPTTLKGYLEFSPDGNWILTGGVRLMSKVNLWDTSNSIPQLFGHTTGLEWGAWSPDGTLLATSSARARVWDATTGQQLSICTDLCKRWGDWSPDGTRLVFTTIVDGPALTIWDVTTGEVGLRFVTEDDLGYYQFITTDWSPNGKFIAGAVGKIGTPQPIYVWDIETTEVVSTLLPNDFCMQAWPHWSPDSTKIVTGCIFVEAGTNSPARIWDAATGEELMTLESEDGFSMRTMWSPDGTRILVTYENSVARIWDAESGEVLLTYAGHLDQVWSGAWSPDGTHIATGDLSGLVKIWNSETAEEIASFTVLGDVMNINWSPDGRHIIVTGTGRNEPLIKRVWTSTDDLIAHAYECCVTRELTAEEQSQFGLPPRD